MKLHPRPFTSSLGSKYLMAITGFMLIGFVVVHLGGNLLVYAGPDALNAYAHGLKSRPLVLWGARTGLFTVFAVHIAFAVRLRIQNAKARPVGYAHPDTLQASWASRNMMLTGLVLLAFVVYHLAHFTLGWIEPAATQVTTDGPVELSSPKNYLDLAEVKSLDGKKYVPEPTTDLRKLEETTKDADARADVYSMVVAGFRNPFVSASYCLAMLFLGLHLWHGGSSWLQSLGLTSPNYARLIGALGPGLAVFVVAGNCSIPLYVMLHFGIRW